MTIIPNTAISRKSCPRRLNSILLRLIVLAGESSAARDNSPWTHLPVNPFETNHVQMIRRRRRLDEAELNLICEDMIFRIAGIRDDCYWLDRPLVTKENRWLSSGICFITFFKSFNGR
ncbi:hypothetical protein CEXT_422851 [Caerostris extrusa]|uniref:Uncharacterized protein n=1 Tax=Caerostris extrusa TaxID=172846 RepID=A0AAV4V6B0_CAEEX|nr:hypothetical protein CEXT_422851 [Caerostris extrusa]